MRKLQRLIAIALALCMVLSVIPPVEVSATTVTPAAKEESNLMVAIAPGDSTWVSESIPCWTVEAVDALLDLYQDNGVARIYWRGLQGEVWNQTQYNLQNGIRSTFHFEGVRRQMLEFEARVGMTIDEYVVKQAHERGMEVYGTASLADFGSGFDIPISSWPCVHNALQRMENPDWVPKDKYGLVEQGGALEYSIKAVRDWFVQMHVEEVEKVGYDGVFFITYSENYSLNYNDQFGYSDEAVQEFYDRYGIIAGKEPFTRYASINDWKHLRGEYITELFRQMRDALDATGRDVKMSLFLDSRDPYYFQGWSPASGLLSDGIYLDLFTYVREGLIDQFVCQGACSYDAQLGTATNMLQLCEGTDIDIAVYTSSANSSVWDDLIAQGVDRVTNVSHEAMLYNRAFNGEEDSPVGAERPIRQWLAQLAESTSTLNLAGTANATLEDITPYLFEKDVNGVQGYKYSLTVRRMAIHAIKTLNLPGASDVFEQVLSTDPEPVVQAVAADGLRYVGDIDSVDELIETLYRQHEFAVIESTVIALYSNANKVAWQASLRSAFEKYAANNFDNCNTKNVRACANILRALSAGSYIDLEFYSRYVETFGPNDSTEVLLDHDLSEVQTRREPGAALAVMEDVIQELWYDALRYWATMGVGNSNTGEGFEKLFELALGDDTITSTPALVSIGNRGKSSAMVGEYRTRALEVMDQVFAACGDGSTRPDKDWIYRPLGDALKFYGDEGVEILEKHLYGEDKILALYAWRDLYIPWTPGAYNEMTEQEYEEAYLQLPDSLKEFATNSLKQDFEDQSVFNQKSSGTVGNIKSTSGSWGSLNAGGVEVSDFVRESSSGTQSLKLVRDGGTSSVVTGRFPELLNGQSYKLSFWVYRTNGGIFTINSRNAVSDHEFQAFVRQDGGMYFYDNEAKAWGTESVFSVPEDQWVQLTFAVSRLNAELTVSITTEDGVTQTADTKIPVNVAEGVDRIQVNMSTVSGGTAYIDDISILTATPVMPQRSALTSISVNDTTVRYDGTAHAVEAVTTLMGDTVPTITYRNAYASDAEPTTQAPVDAGTYLVTATAEYEGVTYTAQAKLTIAPAAPNFDDSMVTAESITYGQKLNESVLAMEDGAITDLNGNVLTGNIVWNNGGQYPVEKGVFSYTINLDNKNYASVTGSIQVDVTEPAKQPVYETVINTLLSQDFENLTFTAKGSGVVAGDKATTGGYWTRINSSVDDADLITTQNGSNVIGLYRDTTQKSISVAVAEGVTANQAFSVSFDFNYATAAGAMTVDMSEQYLFYIKANGALVYWDAAANGWSTVTQMSVPVGQWVNFRVDVASDGSFTLIMTDANGLETIAANKGSISNAMDYKAIDFNAARNAGGVIGYIDNVQITTTQTVEVDTTEYEKVIKLEQNFEELTFTAKGTGVVAGDKATTGGYWTRINSSVDDADLITTQNGSKVIGLYRDTTQKSVSVAVTDGFLANQDFTVSFDYCYATADGAMIVDANKQNLFYIKANGTLVYWDATANGWSSVAQLTVPVGRWVNFRVDVASDGSFTLTMTDADGKETVAANKGSISNTVDVNAINFSAARNAGGLIGYIDNVQMYTVVVVEEGPKYAYTQLMAQNFDNAEIFKLENYANNKLNPADFGGTALDGASFNINGDVVTLVTEEGGNQYYSARRLLDETTKQFGVNMVSSTSAGLKSCYEWSIDIKTEADAYFTVDIGKGSGTEMSFILGPDYITPKEDESKKLTFDQGEWTTIKFWADRDAGSYTFSIGNQSATVTTDLLGTIDVNQFSISGRGPRANNYVYIDNVSFAKADLILPYEVVDVEISDTVQMYTGSEKTVSVNAGGATGYTVWYNGSTEAPTQTGTYDVQVLVTEKGYRGSAMGTLTIEQADVPMDGEALRYIEVTKGTSLASLNLGVTFLQPGVLSWDDTAVLDVSGEYGWTFVPENSNYKTIGGSVYVNVQNGEDAVAQVGQTTYASMALAIEKAAAGSTVTMIANAAEAGFVVDKNVTVDFAGKSLRVTAGTIELAPDTMVVLKNGTITGNGGTLLQNAADLTLTDMVLSTSGTAIFNGPDRALTVNYTYIPEAITVTGGITVKDAAKVNISGGIFTASIKDGWCADGYQGVANGDGTYTVMDKDLCNAAKIGNAYFATLDEAVNAAVDGATITMLRDADVGHLLLTGAVTLDLNGHTLAAPDAVVAISGQIIDSTDGEGAVITPVKNVLLHEDNSYLPLYDSALGGYRFYSYSFDMLGVRTDGATGNPVFGIRLSLSNTDGYTLMANADNGMTIRVRLTWEGMNVAAPEFVFSTDLVATYAHYMETIPYYALMVRVAGAERKVLTVEAIAETESRMEANVTPFTYSVPAE